MSTPARVQIYGSSVSGNMKYKSGIAKIEQVLAIRKIPYDFIDVATDETAKMYMKRKNLGVTTELPQIFVDGEYKGLFAQFEEAVEFDELDQFLGLQG